MNRIKYTTTGAIINGKQVGYRYLKKYYKQYLERSIDNPRVKYQPAIEQQNNDWKITKIVSTTQNWADDQLPMIYYMMTCLCDDLYFNQMNSKALRQHEQKFFMVYQPESKTF